MPPHYGYRPEMERIHLKHIETGDMFRILNNFNNTAVIAS